MHMRLGHGHGQDPTRRRHPPGRASTALRALQIGWAGARLIVATGCLVAFRRMEVGEALARRLRPTLSQLGATFVKVGQTIASSPDSLPESLVRACSPLRDHVSAEPVDVVALLQRELGDGARQFSSVSSEPIAAASIAQVYFGRLVDGEPVVVKVQRSKVARRLSADTRLLVGLARFGARISPRLRQADLVALVENLCHQLRSELDFGAELENARIMRQALDGTEVRVPHFYEDLCTSRILVMEYLPGQQLSSCADHLAASGRGPAVGRELLASLLVPLASSGVFHADMHGGNLIIGPTGTVGLVDFGSIGTLDDPTRSGVVRALLALFEHRFDEAAPLFLSMMDLSGADLPAACQELQAITSTYLDRPVAEIPMGVVLGEMLEMARHHGLVLPPALLPLLRQVLYLDGLSRTLDRDFNFIEEGAAILRSSLAGEAVACAAA